MSAEERKLSPSAAAAAAAASSWSLLDLHCYGGIALAAVGAGAVAGGLALAPGVVLLAVVDPALALTPVPGMVALLGGGVSALVAGVALFFLAMRRS